MKEVRGSVRGGSRSEIPTWEGAVGEAEAQPDRARLTSVRGTGKMLTGDDEGFDHRRQPGSVHRLLVAIYFERHDHAHSSQAPGTNDPLSCPVIPSNAAARPLV